MRRASDPAARLERLRQARKRLKKGELFNADEMAGVAGMTWRNMKPMVEGDESWPVLRRGSEGVAWQFDGRAVLDHMIAGLEAAQRQRNARAARVAKMTGLSVEQAQSDLSVSDLAKVDQLQTSAQRRKIEQRDWVRRIETEEVITGIFSTMQMETLATVSRLDPAGRWPPTVRAEVADAMRTLLVRVHDQVSGWLTPDAGPKSKPRARVIRARK